MNVMYLMKVSVLKGIYSESSEYGIVVYTSCEVPTMFTSRRVINFTLTDSDRIYGTGVICWAEPG